MKSHTMYNPKGLCGVIRDSRRGRTIWSKNNGLEIVTDGMYMLRVPSLDEVQVKVELLRTFETMIADGSTLTCTFGQVMEKTVDLDRIWKPEEAIVDGTLTEIKFGSHRLCAFNNGMIIGIAEKYAQMMSTEKVRSRAISDTDLVYFGDGKNVFGVVSPIVTRPSIGDQVKRILGLEVMQDDER